MEKRKKLVRRTIISVLVILLLLLSACGPPEGQAVPPGSGNATVPPASENVTFPPMPQVPQPPFPDKGNPKLDTFLNQLIAADKRGEAESFARKRAVQLVDGKVKVEIEAMPGWIDVATNATAAVGIVEAVAAYMNMFDAVVPIDGLESLAAEESIRMIRNPARPVFP